MMNMVWWIVLGILFIGGPLVASAVICVPKWYQQKVAPTWAGRKLSSVREWVLLPKRGLPSWVHNTFSIIGLIALSPAIIFAVLVAIWVDACRVVVSRACPYSSSVTDGPVVALIEFLKEMFSNEES